MKQSDLTCEAATIFFSSWRPHFHSRTPHARDNLDFPVWVQIVNLCQVLREDTFLRTIGEQIGQVIHIDNSDAYKAKLFGPRIRLLTKDLNNLPQTVVIPRLDGEGMVEYELEFSGLPHQCGRCRSRDHQVRHCPKNQEVHVEPRPGQRQGRKVRHGRTWAPAPHLPPALQEDPMLQEPDAQLQESTPEGLAKLKGESDVSPRTTARTGTQADTDSQSPRSTASKQSPSSDLLSTGETEPQNTTQAERPTQGRRLVREHVQDKPDPSSSAPTTSLSS